MNGEDLGKCSCFQWNECSATIPPSFSFHRVTHHKAFVFGHKIYIVGGNSDLWHTREAENVDVRWLPVLDTVVCQWEAIPIPSEVGTREHHEAFAINDKVYFFGGQDNTMEITCQQWCLDVVDRSCIPKKVHGTNPFPLSASAGAFVERLKLFVLFGGIGADNSVSNRVLCLNAGSMEWYEPAVSGAKPAGRKGASACVVDKTIYVYGGEGAVGGVIHEFGQLLALTENYGVWNWTCLYDPSAQRPKPLISPRSHCAMKAAHGRVFIYGGRIDGGTSKDLFFYSIDDESMHKVADGRWPKNHKFLRYGTAPYQLSNHQMATLGSRIIVTGGSRLKSNFMTLEADTGYVGENFQIELKDLEELFPDSSPYEVVPAVSREIKSSEITKILESVNEVNFTAAATAKIGYLVSADWMRSLERFMTSESCSDIPGPVNNSAMFEKHGFYEKLESALPKYCCVSEQAWNVFMKWFGGMLLLSQRNCFKVVYGRWSCAKTGNEEWRSGEDFALSLRLHKGPFGIS